MTEDPRVIFGRRLQMLRKKRGISQEELAFAANLDRTYVSGIERGKRNISIINIYRLAEALELPPASLFETSEQE